MHNPGFVNQQNSTKVLAMSRGFARSALVLGWLVPFLRCHDHNQLQTSGKMKKKLKHLKASQTRNRL